MNDERKLRLIISKNDKGEERSKNYIHPNFFAAPTNRTLGDELKKAMESKGIAWNVNDSYNARRFFSLDREKDFVYYPVERLESSGQIVCSAFRIGSHDLARSSEVIQTVVFSKDTPCSHIEGYLTITLGPNP